MNEKSRESILLAIKGCRTLLRQYEHILNNPSAKNKQEIESIAEKVIDTIDYNYQLLEQLNSETLVC